MLRECLERLDLGLLLLDPWPSGFKHGREALHASPAALLLIVRRSHPRSLCGAQLSATGFLALQRAQDPVARHVSTQLPHQHGLEPVLAALEEAQVLPGLAQSPGRILDRG